MRELRGRNALVTGASGGLGEALARRLASEGVNLVLGGTREDALHELARTLEAQWGVRTVPAPCDLAAPGASQQVVQEAEATLGSIDLLINNAGREAIGPFPDFATDELTALVAINLTAPMLLTHAALPGMLRRGCGHVVFVSSVAGKVGPPFNEPYAATKAGLIGLTQSLRAEYRGGPVGFSVVCPGFIAGDGMWERWRERGMRSNRTMGETTVERVVDAVLEAIRKDLAERIESGAPIRPLLAIQQLFPRLAEAITARSVVRQLFADCADLADAREAGSRK